MEISRQTAAKMGVDPEEECPFGVSRILRALLKQHHLLSCPYAWMIKAKCGSASDLPGGTWEEVVMYLL